MKYDVFISYRRKNGFEMAQLIRDRLKAKGLECFLDTEELHSGKFSEEIIDAIKGSKNFLAVLPKNALDRCVNEDDWVRTEIMTAIEEKINIIPVIYPDFKWPKRLFDKLPKEIVNLQYQQGVPASQDYFSSMIEKIISYLKDVKLKPVTKTGSLYYESSRFIGDKACSTNGLISVDMAFHSGSEWRRNNDMVNTLNMLQQMGCRLRVLVNTPKAAEIVCKHMRMPNKKYIPFKDSIKEWCELAQQYPNMEVRALDIPLLHRLYVVRGENDGSASVKYYSYGNYIAEKDYRREFEYDDAGYALYADEFDYLWRIAEKK